MSRFFLPALAAFAIFISANAAYANCDDYGATAARQHNENQTNSCGYSGLRWHGNEAGHAGFCRLVGEGAASAETAFREAQLAKCRPESVEDVVAEEPEEEVATDQEATQCRKSDIAEGKGASKRDAENAARDLLGRTRAEMVHDGLSQCNYYALGCSGPNNDKTCWMSVTCCAN